MNKKRAESVYNNRAASRPINVSLNEVIKVVAGGCGNGEHFHDDYWTPDTPGVNKPYK